MTILDGKKIKEEKLEELKKEIESLERSPGIAVIQVGSDSASDVYVKNKEKTALELESLKKRYEEKFKTEYPKRKQTVEKIFGDCKEHHGLRYTRVRGLEKNSNQALLIFACHNLKKMSLWRYKKRPLRAHIFAYF